MWTHVHPTEDHTYAELGDLATGTKLSRTSDFEITLFKSMDLGIEDYVSARLAYTNAGGKSDGQKQTRSVK